MIGGAEVALDLSRTTIESHYYGVYPAIVVDNQDPDGQGRVLVRLPWSPDSSGAAYEAWARLATMMGGKSRGTWFIPDTEDEVLVSFQAGDPRLPFVVGAMWNGQDTAPESIDSDNNIKSIVSRTGIRITLDDTRGAATLTLKTPAGQSVVLTDSGAQITVSDLTGNSIQLAPGGVTITSAGPLNISAPTVSCDFGLLNIDAAMSTFSGVLQCDVLLAETVVASTYTPGLGNSA